MWEDSLIEHFKETHEDLKVMMQSKDVGKNSLIEPKIFYWTALQWGSLLDC